MTKIIPKRYTVHRRKDDDWALHYWEYDSTTGILSFSLWTTSDDMAENVEKNIRKGLKKRLKRGFWDVFWGNKNA